MKNEKNSFSFDLPDNFSIPNWNDNQTSPEFSNSS